ncbi:MAG: bifunctional 2-C-methyl-D-erythritol 4-phosphate cytidylyltransferase/2-C-methyl-D-erythritol 2,4-cyclodiphosphate synthase [Bosea sp. (in: a-proteobacteria)]
MHFAVLIVAAGNGLRAGGGLPKQFRMLAGRPVLARTISAFLVHSEISTIRVVILPEYAASYATAIANVSDPARRIGEPVHGGATRQQSVCAGLQALAAEGFSGHVLVHDAARPLASETLILRALAVAETSVAAIPAFAVTDTIKRIDASGIVVETPNRKELVAVQTPQVFAFDALLAAHQAALVAGRDDFTDDAALTEWAGHKVVVFEGDVMNIKLTHADDFAIAEGRLGQRLVTRVGTGYDVHAFTTGEHIWLGGVKIAHERGVKAHSDGDVALHALTDAILGTLSDGDIGSHFPPSDPQWRGASSDRFLAFACERVEARGGKIDHLDLTLVCEAPRVGPHREAMRARIAEIASLRIDQVSIKATTSERMGFTGRGEGLSALATATLRLPEAEA